MKDKKKDKVVELLANQRMINDVIERAVIQAMTSYCHIGLLRIEIFHRNSRVHVFFIPFR